MCHLQDPGSFELGFRGQQSSSRQWYAPGNTALAIGDKIRELHDHQMPPCSVDEPQTERQPSRHAPWRSSAERLTKTPELALIDQLRRTQTAALRTQTHRLSHNPSRSPPVEAQTLIPRVTAVTNHLEATSSMEARNEGGKSLPPSSLKAGAKAGAASVNSVTSKASMASTVTTLSRPVSQRTQ